MAISAPPEPSGTAPKRRPDGATDSELVAAVRRGSDRAFEALYGRYHRRVAGYVRGRVRDHGRAEDITQEIFLSALRRMRASDRPVAFKPWIYEIAKNACIDQFRHARRGGDEVSLETEEGREHGHLTTTGPSADVEADRKETIAHLQGAFGGLSPTHHEILVLREFEGRSYRDIGVRLGLSRAAVESTLFRARRKLGQEYDELVSGERCARVEALIDEAVRALPGVADRRRLAAHLSHCQQCRRQARLAGLDDTLFVAPRGPRAKVAALFPLPALLERRWGLGADATSPVRRPLRELAQLGAQHGGNFDVAFAGWAKAAVAATTLAVAGVAVHGETDPDAGTPPAASQSRLAPVRDARTVSGPTLPVAPRRSGAGAARRGAGSRVAVAGGAGTSSQSPPRSVRRTQSREAPASMGPAAAAPSPGRQPVHTRDTPAAAVPALPPLAVPSVNQAAGAAVAKAAADAKATVGGLDAPGRVEQAGEPLTGGARNAIAATTSAIAPGGR